MIYNDIQSGLSPAHAVLVRRRLVSVFKLAIPLLSVQFMPPFLLYIGIGSSLAEGTAVAIFVILAVYVITEAGRTRRCVKDPRAFEIGPFVFAAFCVLWIVPHAAVSEHFQSIDVARLLKTTPLLFLLIAGAVALGNLLLEAPNRDINWILRLSFSVLCLSLLLKLFGLEPRSNILGKPLFPFTETSHFVLAFVPLLLYRCANCTRRATFGWLAFGFGVALGLQSLTLLIACILAAIVCRRILFVSLVGLVAGLGIIPLEFDYFISRLDLTSSSNNISSLVYVQGWQLLWESCAQTFGWGVGFEQLGGHGTNATAADTILALLSDSGLDALNLTDGSFVFAKLTGEMGIFGFLLSVGFVIAAFRSIRALRKTNVGEQERSIIVFARCVLTSFIIDMFVRGTGYFVGSTLLAITAASILASGRHRLDFFAMARALNHSGKVSI